MTKHNMEITKKIEQYINNTEKGDIALPLFYCYCLSLNNKYYIWDKLNNKDLTTLKISKTTSDTKVLSDINFIEKLEGIDLPYIKSIIEEYELKNILEDQDSQIEIFKKLREFVGIKYKSHVLDENISKNLIKLLNPKHGKFLISPNAFSFMSLNLMEFLLDKKVLKYSSITVQDKLNVNLSILEMEFYLSSYHRANFLKGHSLFDYEKTIGNEAGTFDTFLSFPTVLAKLNYFNIDVESFKKEERFKNLSKDTFRENVITMYEVETALNSLNEDGRGAVLFIGKSHLNGDVFKRYFEENIVEGIIQLPTNLLEISTIGLSIVIFNKNKKTKDVFMINAVNDYTKTKNGYVWEAEKTVDTYINKNCISGYSSFISQEELKENAYIADCEEYVYEKFEEEKINLNELNIHSNRNLLPFEKLVDSFEEVEYELKKLSDLFDFKIGLRISKDDISEVGGDDLTPVYSATKSNSPFGYVKEVKKIARKDLDLIIPARGTSIGYSKLPKENSTATQSTIMAVSKTNSKLVSRYVNEYLSHKREVLFKLKSDIIPQINKTDLANIIIPIPSEKVMQQSIDIMDEQEKIINQAKKQLDIENDYTMYLKQSLFHK